MRTVSLDELAFMQWLLDSGFRCVRPISDTHWAGIQPLLYTHAVVTGKIGDHYGYDDRWCYHSFDMAQQALERWDGTGEPEGWHRHPVSGRRRPEGEKTAEYVAP